MPPEVESLVHPLEPKLRRVWPKIILGGVMSVAALGLAAYLGLVVPAKKAVAAVKQLSSSATVLVAAVKTQDLVAIEQQVASVEEDLATLEKDYGRLGWLKAMPVVNRYYRDGKHGLAAAREVLEAGSITLAAIVPYADVVGLKGLQASGDSAKTAEDRLNFIINTLDKLQPQLSQIGQRLTRAQGQVDQIDPSRYPEDIRGVRLRSQIAAARLLLDQAAAWVNDAQPLLEAAPFILGQDAPRQYLVIFQNDAELRPTGGFMTAYAILAVDKGKVSIIQSNDIYTLDAKFPKRLPAPEPIRKYLPNVPYWYLRDQNLSPDFKVAMDTFLPNYRLTKSPPVDGVIAVDTQLLVDLLEVTGPIGVPGFGNYSAEIDARCNCPQVFYQLELLADVEGPVVWDSVSGQIVVKPRSYGERKSFIGPMMHSVLANVMAQPKHKIPQLFNAITAALNGKHALFYFTDPGIQAAAEGFNLAGRVRPTDEDYLLVVDSNFAGAKTNAWVTYSAQQEIEVSADGGVTKTLTLTYKNPQRDFTDPVTKLRLNGLFRDWLRVYVPADSQLLEAKGLEAGQAASEDLGKTVFEGFFTLSPLNVKTVSFKYQLPFKVKSPYRLLVQKQGGTKDFPYQITINGQKLPEFSLSADRELVLAF